MSKVTIEQMHEEMVLNCMETRDHIDNKRAALLKRGIPLEDVQAEIRRMQGRLARREALEKFMRFCVEHADEVRALAVKKLAPQNEGATS